MATPPQPSQEPDGAQWLVVGPDGKPVSEAMARLTGRADAVWSRGTFERRGWRAIRLAKRFQTEGGRPGETAAPSRHVSPITVVMKLRPKLVLPRADTHDDHQPSETRPEQEQTPPDGPSIVDILEDAKNHLSGTRYRGGDLSFPENFRLTGNGVVPRKTSRSALRHYDLGEKLPFPLTHLRHARHQGHRVIIKTVHRPSRDDRGPLNNAIKEVAVGIRLRQQHCRHEAGAHRLIMTDDEAYIIAREVGTENLARLCFRMNCGEAISSKDALRLARDLTEFVLDMVRLGYAHNDFHGNNIRIYQTEKGLRAKIIDFELASPFDPKGRKVDIGKLGNHLATLFEGMANTPSDLAERVDEHIKEALRAHTQEAVEASLSALNRMLKAAYRECARTTT